jgi:1-acyl-sn-glycerol-3-phosphate acyltransferase
MGHDGLAVAVLSGHAFIALTLVWRSARQCPDGLSLWAVYLIERVYVPLMFRWRATNGPSPLPSAGGALVIANHRSPVDPMMVWMNHHLRAASGHRTQRVIGFLTAREYCDPPGVGWIVRTMQSIPVDRNGRDMGPVREAIRRLKNGRLVGIFPEGGITSGKGLGEPNTGVAFLALKAGVPVYPVFIDGTFYDEASGMTAPFMRRQTVRVTYGEQVDLSEYSGRRLSQDTLVEVTNLLMAKLASLGGVEFRPAVHDVEKPANESAAAS